MNLVRDGTVRASTRRHAAVNRLKKPIIPADIHQADVFKDLSILYPGVPVDLKANPAFPPGAHTEELVWSAVRSVDRQVSRAGQIIRYAEFLGHLERRIDQVLLEGVTQNVLVHAGVVATGAGAILLPAPSGSGKSTLVSALCLAGYSYFSDEFAILNIHTGVLHPFPKSISLKEGGWRALTTSYDIPTRIATATRATGETVRFFAPETVAPPGTHTTARTIIMPSREPGSRVTLEPVTRTDAIATLFEQSLNLPDHGVRGMERIAQSVERAQCFRLTYDNLEEAVDAISAMVPSDAARSAASRSARIS